MLKGTCYLFLALAATGAGNSALAGIHQPLAAPPVTISGTLTTVIISTYIPDTSLIPSGVNLLGLDASGQFTIVLGSLNDSGLNGDEALGDRVYSITITVSRAAVFEVSAAFKGVLRRQTATVMVPAVLIPEINTPTDFNNQASLLFTTSIAIRSQFESLLSSPLPDSGVLSQLASLQNQLGSTFGSLSAISASRFPQPFTQAPRATTLQQRRLIGSHPSDVVSAIPGGDAINTLLQLTQAGQTAQDMIALFEADGTNPQVSRIATYATSICGLGEADLGDPSEAAIRQQCAEMYELGGSPNSFITTVRTTGATFGIESTLEAPTDLIGDALSSLLGLGTVATNAIEGAGGIIIDFFSNSTASSSGVVVSQVGNPGTVQLPIATNTLVYSFGAATAPATADVPVSSTGNAPITFTPGQDQNLSGPPTQFLSTGSMTTPRVGHTAILLANGKVLIAGGANNAQPLASAELYDPSSGTFTTTGSMHQARAGHTATVLTDGRVLVAGGMPLTASAEIYDPTTGLFTLTESLTIPRENHAAALLNNGKVLVAGGASSSNEQASAELYDPIAGTFTATGNMTSFRESPTATLILDGSVLVAGGFFNPGGADSSISTAELYDSSTGTFALTGAMTTQRVSHTATILESGKVLIAGGNNFTGGGRGNNLLSAELYDPSAAIFTVTGSMNEAREEHTATTLYNSSVLIVGGFDFSVGAIGTSEIFVPTAQLFQPGPNLIVARYQHTTTRLLNGTVLVTGGIGQTGPLASAEIGH